MSARLSRASMLAMLALVASVSPVRAQTATDARAVNVESAREVVRLDTSRLTGDPAVLAWSADGGDVYVMGATRDKWGKTTKVTHLSVTLDGGAVRDLPGQPEAAQSYWDWKSARSSPADPTFRLDVGTNTEAKHAVSAPTGGDLARGGGLPSNDAVAYADGTQRVLVNGLSYKGEVVGEWRNQQIAPGTTFGWAPPPFRLLVYAKGDAGALWLLDQEGRKAPVAGTRAALLPAFSPDGRRLAWFEKVDKKHYVLKVAAVSTR